MGHDLASSSFKFFAEEKFNRFDLDSISKNSPIGYILERTIKNYMIVIVIILYVLKK